MATYIQGQADYISQIQPTEPNLAFDAQILQAKQSKYDANHKRVSELYGSLLNASLTRTDNSQSRDEFFKIINDDIKRMGGLDFSLDQNVQAAAGVFQSVYTNNNIVKDMVWTKNYNNQVNRSESFKNCLDEEKCGGMYWEEGDKFLQYKKMEFKNASAGDAMNMSDPEYVPYRSVAKEAIKLAKAADLNVEEDRLNGGYIVTTKNGLLLKTPLTELFSSTIGADPNFIKQFKIQSFVDRNDKVNAKIANGEFDNQTDAQMSYLRDIDKSNKLKIENASNLLNVDSGYITEKFEEMKKEYETGKFKEGSDDYNKMISLSELQNQVKYSQQYLERINKISALDNKNAAISTLSDAIDEQTALANLFDEINSAANTLSKKDKKLSLKADEFAKMAQDYRYDMSKLATQHRYAVELDNLQADNKIKFEEWKIANDHKDYAPLTADKALELSIAKEKLQNEINTFDSESNARNNFKDPNGIPVSSQEIINWSKATDAATKNKYKEYKTFLETETKKLENKKLELDKNSIKLGEEPLYPELLSKNSIQSVENKNSGYKDEWKNRTVFDFGEKYPRLTDSVFDEAYENASSSENLTEAIDSYLQNYYQLY